MASSCRRSPIRIRHPATRSTTSSSPLRGRGPYTCATCDPNNPSAPVNVADYAKALTYITGKLSDLTGGATDLRQAYVDNTSLGYKNIQQALDGLSYPGTGSGFTSQEFTNLVAELKARSRLARQHAAAHQALQGRAGPH